MTYMHCVVQGCKITIFNKPIGVTFHNCPTSHEMRNKWLHALRNKCAVLDWSKSRICSKHFEHKYFDAQRKLKENAIPTLFPLNKLLRPNELSSKFKVDKLLTKVSQSELMNDIRNSINKIKEPANFDNMVTEDLQCKADASKEAQLWLIIKKQENLNSRLLEAVEQNKKHSEVLQKNMDDTRSSKKSMDQNIETYKYIVKCLQEKLATLEEQIEILTAVESR
ncbi:unnamed protein product [Danaus chrysippus]|uniref:(African queen) hypothetical protein n=1 Tax=Danaus chrysippus TaxID=151541 RepID=A0A8J2QK67_9NEOP|nr:unnamed protein product [Danaus chrysippus]